MATMEINEPSGAKCQRSSGMTVSFIVKVGEVVQLRPTSKMQERVADNLTAGRSPVPPWLDLDVNEKKGTVRGLPLREDIQIPVQEQLIVELFSK